MKTETTKWPDALSTEDRKRLAEGPVDRSLYEQLPPPHPVQLVACLEAEIKMLRKENARLSRQLFEARYKDWL